MKTAAKPGWYPAPDMPNAVRYWNGFQWTEHVAPKPVGNLTAIRRIAAGIVVAVVALGFIAAINSSNDDVDCEMRNAERQFQGSSYREAC